MASGSTACDCRRTLMMLTIQIVGARLQGSQGLGSPRGTLSTAVADQLSF
jgi:hypothetical protein